MLAVLGSSTGCAPAPAGAPAARAPVPAAAAAGATAAAPASITPTTGPGAGASDQVAAPVGVRLAGIDVEADVVAVGVDDEGEMQVPEDVTTVGWYRFGPGPGSTAGSSVLSGHVDDRVQGRGAFYRLADAALGDPVRVELADGAVVDFRVTAVERIDKSELPVDRLFARTGAPRLTLVTCGGAFDRSTRDYRQNVVVTAEPVGAAGPAGR